MSDELIDRLRDLELPLHDNVQSIFNGTCAARRLVDQAMTPLLNGMINKTAYEEAVVGIYYRIGAWLKSLELLSHPVHVQAVHSGGRSIFKLLMDVKLLILSPADAEKFHDFVFVERFRAASQAVAFADDHHAEDASKVRLERAFINKPSNQTHLETLCQRNGWWDTSKNKPRKIDHWSQTNAFERARLLGLKYEEFYRFHYPQLSWNIHAGAVGLGGVSAVGIEAAFGQAHTLIQDMVYDATESIGVAFRLFDAEPDLREECRLRPRSEPILQPVAARQLATRNVVLKRKSFCCRKIRVPKA